MKPSDKTLRVGFFAVLMAVTGLYLDAQSGIIFEEDFSGGFPAGWSTTDASGNNRLWSYCSDPNNQTPAPAGSTVGCHRIWDDALNAQSPFAAETAANGFMTVDSDAAGNVTHTSRLDSPALDFSAWSTTILEFQSHIGVFTLDAATNALLQVSTDGANWTDFVVFPGLVTGTPNPPTERWSFNPTLVSIDISSVAANQQSVFLRWQWLANYEYHWDLDDVVIYDRVPQIFEDGFESGDTAAWSSTM